MFKNNFTFDKKQRICLTVGLAILIATVIFYSIILNLEIECESPDKFITIPKFRAARLIFTGETIFQLFRNFLESHSQCASKSN